MRDALDNPFTPGSDTVPNVWAGRQEHLDDWSNILRIRRTNGVAERGRTILGEPGLGKSTLVRRIAALAEAEGDWTTPQVRIPLGVDPLPAVAAAVLRLADRAGLAGLRRLTDVLSRVRQVAVAGVSVTVDRAPGSPTPHADLTALLVEIGLAARAQKRAVLVHVDEIQNISDRDALSRLLIALGDALAHEEQVTAPGGATFTEALPLAVYLTGLPEFADTARERGGATFARRFKTTTLKPIDDTDFSLALRAFIEPGWPVVAPDGEPAFIRMDPDAAKAVIDLSRGEPFLFQLAGERAWYADNGPVITREHVLSGWALVRSEAESHVENTLRRLPSREREMLDAMASLEPEERTLLNIAKAMGFEKGAQAGPTASRLDTSRGIIERGKPYRFRHRAIEAYLTTDWPFVE